MFSRCIQKAPLAFISARFLSVPGYHVDSFVVCTSWSYNNFLKSLWHRLCTFIGQVNNVLCYFPRFAAVVEYQLFRSCNSIFGCELWHLNNININTFCAGWRTGLMRIRTVELR